MICEAETKFELTFSQGKMQNSSNSSVLILSFLALQLTRQHNRLSFLLNLIKTGSRNVSKVSSTRLD